MGDLLIFEIRSILFGLETTCIDRVIEVERVSFLPGRTGFVRGVVSLAGEPVTVVDAERALCGAGQSSTGPTKVVVTGDGQMLIGFDIGNSEITFAWQEELEERDDPSVHGPFVGRAVNFKGRPVGLLDWKGLFGESARILSSEGLARGF